MADDKTTTELTAASALTGAEIVPLVQGGNSRKSAVSALLTYLFGGAKQSGRTTKITQVAGDTYALAFESPSTAGAGLQIEFVSNAGATPRVGSFQQDNSGNYVWRQISSSMFFDYWNNAYFRDSGGVARLQLTTLGAIFIGGRIESTRVITAAGVIGAINTDHIIIVNKTVGAASAVNLMASPGTGRVFVIKDGKGDAATNNITITPSAGTIDGAATLVMNVNYQSVTLVYNGTEWNVL